MWRFVGRRGLNLVRLLAATVALGCAAGGGQALAGTSLLLGVSEDGPKWPPPPGYPASEATEARGLGLQAFRITVPWSTGQTQLSTTTIGELNRATSLLGSEFRLVVSVYGPPTGDVTATWTTSSPAEYVSSTGEVRVRVRGTRSLSFRTTTDLVRFTVEY